MTTLRVITSVQEMQWKSSEARKKGRVGLVPTMGALHEGHLSLVRAAKLTCDTTIVSIFVNPTQFGPGEDFTRYPRTFESDLSLLESEGVEIVFSPSADQMYPSGSSSVVHVGGIGERLDGKFRPGHFQGVATIVAKLFHIAQPHTAFFGQKDAAQVAVLQTMVRDLNFPLELKVCPTVREPDGLAMSSRNQYLSPAERRNALVLRRALTEAEELVEKGTRDAASLREAVVEVFRKTANVALEYAELVSPDTLLPISTIGPQPALLAVAAKVGVTRLIDNVLLAPDDGGSA